MTAKKTLIILPLVLIAFLVQSYFWVPTYEEQTKGNPERLKEFITASIGDASMLNPILSSDSASSDIVGLVFEGLIDRDKDLRFRGRLASSWEIYEETFFYVNDNAEVPGLGKAGRHDLKKLLETAKEDHSLSDSDLKKSLNNIREIVIVPPKEETFTVSGNTISDKYDHTGIQVDVRAPIGIKMILEKVDQDLFKNLELILGEDYFLTFDGTPYITTDPVVDDHVRKNCAQKFLPAYEQNPVLVFHLRPNVKFHDGHIFDAGDVKFTYEAIMDPENLSPRTSDYEPVKSVEIIDPLTIRITYKRLYSPALGTWSMQILPEHLLNHAALTAEAVGQGKNPETFSIRHSIFNRHPVGCGPFMFSQWKADQYIMLNRYDDYWEGPPLYERYVYRIIPDLLNQEMEFYAGTIDNYSVRPHQVARLKNDSTYQNFSGLAFGYNYIGYNLRRKLFEDPAVRRALGMAIDVNKIIKYVLYDQGERISGPFAKQTDYYDQTIPVLPYDPEGAQKILKDMGWVKNSDGQLEKDGKKFQFTLITNNGNPIREEILAIAQDSWKKIGIDVRTDRVEWSVFIQERVNKLDFDALILGWSMDIDPDFYQIWHSSQTHPQQLNFVGFKNEAADDLIIKIRQEYDHDTLVQYCHKLHEIIAAEQPYTFLNVSRWTAVLDKRIVVKEVDENGQMRYKKIESTKTGNYAFDFNKWIKLPEKPVFAP